MSSWWLTELVRWSGAAIVAAIVTWAALHPPYKNTPPIRSDGLGYHVWTRAILERDFTFCRWVRDAGREQFSFVDFEHNRCQVRYPPGLALLQFPVMAFLVDTSPGAPFVSAGEHKAALLLAAFALSLIALLVTDAARRLGAAAWSTSLAVWAGAFGTGLFHYATYDASFTHVYSALGVSIALWLGARAWKNHARLPIVPLLLLGFFLVLLRSTNVLIIGALAAVAAIVFIPEGASWKSKRAAIAAIQNLWPLALGSVIGEAVQVAYNSYANGRLSGSSYADVHFDFASPHQLDVLFSYERGLFTWYPWLLVAFVAALVARQTRPYALAMCGTFAAFVVLYGFWFSWCLGGGFGHRGFIELIPTAMLCFAAALGALRRVAQIAAVTLTLLTTFATLELLTGYWKGHIDFQGTTSRIYWAHVAGKDSLLPVPLIELDRGPPFRAQTCIAR